MKLAQAVDRAIASVRADAPEYLGAGVVDLTTGMLLAVDTVDHHPRDVLDVLASATTNLFQGRSVSDIEKMWQNRRGRGNTTDHQFQEILLHSDHLVHLFVRSATVTDLVVAVICRRSANLGLLLSVGRQAVGHLSDG
ncbi:hypothetical protein [Kineosporia sp. R_H_3]|uniref:hypothetical protein n=1 Tax=Kineosporia sp. R_H_3 TaxID=1961848 RepID=UPI000B4BC851|nr:hypothetical protein [Kineosporia sp. R_H_3]